MTFLASCLSAKASAPQQLFACSGKYPMVRFDVFKYTHDTTMTFCGL